MFGDFDVPLFGPSNRFPLVDLPAGLARERFSKVLHLMVGTEYAW